MWEEIEITDNIKLDEFISIWNDREDCIDLFDKERIQKINERKEDVHCYIFRGKYHRIIMLYKHDTYDNTTYIFIQNSTIVLSTDDIYNLNKSSEIWKAYVDFMLMLLKKHNSDLDLV